MSRSPGAEGSEWTLKIRGLFSDKFQFGQFILKSLTPKRALASISSTINRTGCVYAASRLAYHGGNRQALGCFS
jgi:hypothetical protein